MKKYVVRMSAGLANRMLQYCYYLYMKKKGYETYVDNNYKPSQWKMEEIDWERIFPYAPIVQAPASLVLKYGGGYSYFDKIRRKYLHFTTKVWSMNNATDVPSESDIARFRYFIGVMQDAAIAEYTEAEAKACFKFADFETGTENFLLAQRMLSEESVSLHVRKGKDYMTHINVQNTCTIDYYQAAVKVIMDRVKSPTFYVFTDNPEWVKDNMNGFEYKLVDINPAIGWGNHYDMQLMTCCKHNIIANSTYSWWGAFLNPNPQKIVIDPRYWYNPQIEEFAARPNKTACKGWILL